MDKLPENREDVAAKNRAARKTFVKWAEEHKANVKEISAHKIVVVSGLDERSYEPSGGLRVEDWHDLKDSLWPRGQGHNPLASR